MQIAPQTDAPTISSRLSLPSRSRTAIGIGVSLLVHAALLFGVLKSPPLMKTEPVFPEQSPITLLLPPAPITPPQVTPEPQPQVQPKRTPPKKSVAPTPKPHVAKPVPPSPPTPPASEVVAIAEPRPTPVAPTPDTTPNEAQPTDMTSMIAAAREKRRAAAEATAPPVESASESTRNDIAKANIQHSLRTAGKRDGTRGVFQILDKGVQTARFSFHGWAPGSSREINQLIEVDAGLQGDVERAIVRKMIALIRSHYPGDFNWESQRLGRVVVLSARSDDNAALETFLLREFFSGRG